MRLDPAYQASLTIMTASNLLALFLAGDKLQYFYMAVGSYFALLAAFIWVEKVIQKSTAKSSSRFRQRYSQWKAELLALSNEEARSRAIRALSDKKSFHIIKAPTTALPVELPPSVRGFFSQYEEVRATRGGLGLSRKLLKRLPNGYVQIGSDDDFVQLAVRPEGELVYEIEPDGSVSSEHPTIYQLILLREKIYNEP